MLSSDAFLETRIADAACEALFFPDAKPFMAQGGGHEVESELSQARVSAFVHQRRCQYCDRTDLPLACDSLGQTRANLDDQSPWIPLSERDLAVRDHDKGDDSVQALQNFRVRLPEQEKG